MKKLILLILAFVSVSLTYGQITSTTTGGNWNNPSTWVGGKVPNAQTDVLIKGTVVHSGKEDACRNLTIDKGAVLTTLSSYMNRYVVNVHGDLVNNGIIRDNKAGDWLFLNVYKNIVNNGIWKNYGVSISGNTGQSISGSQPFSPYFIQTINANNILAGSNLAFQGTTLLFYKKNNFIIGPDKTVTFSYSDTYKRGEFMPPDNTAQGVKFTGGGKVLVKGNYSVSGAAFDAIDLEKDK